jgi:hypothetical protein
MARELCVMSWAYWGIVTGLLALVVMLLVCMDVLSSKSITNRSTATQAGGEAGAGRTQPSTTNQRAA